MYDIIGYVERTSVIKIRTQSFQTWEEYSRSPRKWEKYISRFQIARFLPLFLSVKDECIKCFCVFCGSFQREIARTFHQWIAARDYRLVHGILKANVIRFTRLRVFSKVLGVSLKVFLRKGRDRGEKGIHIILSQAHYRSERLRSYAC